MVAEKQNIERIQDLWMDIHHKFNFIRTIAPKVDRSELSIKNHWFGGFWRIPEDFQEQVIDEMEKTVKEQKHGDRKGA